MVGPPPEPRVWDLARTDRGALVREHQDLLSEHSVVSCPAGGHTVNANGAGLNWTDISCLHYLRSEPGRERGVLLCWINDQAPRYYHLWVDMHTNLRRARWSL